MPLDQVARSTKLTEREKIFELSKGFEAILVRNILESAQKPLFNKKGADNTATAGIYRDMVSSQTADMISRSGTLGLARQLEQELASRSPAASPKPSSQSHP
jgi:Rod binding domain-containing protein